MLTTSSTQPPPSSSSSSTLPTDEDDQWIPLTSDSVDPSSTTQTSNKNDNTSNLQRIQRKLEGNVKMKQSLVDHPLDHAWKLLLIHLARELWEEDLSIRLGMVMVLLGTIFQSLVMATFLSLRTLLLLTLVFASWIHVVPPQRSHLKHLKHLVVALLLLPTYLEARTVGFLSLTVAQMGWGYNLLVGCLLGVLVVYRRQRLTLVGYRRQRLTTTPRQDIHFLLYTFHGLALMLSLWKLDIHTIPGTAGPWLLSSGGLLLLPHSQNYSRALRQALRHTVRDTLATVSDQVQQDEMLQLAMVRWIVDYWSTTTTTTTTFNTTTTSTQENKTSTVPIVEAGTLVVSDATTRTDRVPPSNTQRRQRLTTTTAPDEIGWADLFPMLQMTTEQMEEEVPRNTQSVQTLRSMLVSMNVDDHAKPAVEAYKEALQPLQRNTAHYVAVSRRMPATLLLIWRLLVLAKGPWSSFTVAPFVVLEVLRLFVWANTLHRVTQQPTTTNNNDPPYSRVLHLPPDMDSMTILLSPDHFSPLRPPTLLQVWYNLQSSVRALETGLTAARCAHTTAVAADFAENIMSLAQLGMEVSQKGWMHGLVVLTQELISYPQQEGRYTRAAKSALRNSQTMVRNVQVLVEEDAPVIGFLQTVVGLGWLWGRSEPPIPESTVVITELPNDDEPTGEQEGSGAAVLGDNEEQDATPSIDEETTTFPSETGVSKETVHQPPVVETMPDETEAPGMVDEIPKGIGLISNAEKEPFTDLITSPAQESTIDDVTKPLTKISRTSEGDVETADSASDLVLSVGTAKELMSETFVSGEAPVSTEIANKVDDTDDLPAMYSSSSWDEAHNEHLDSASWEARASEKIEPVLQSELGDELTYRLQLEPEEGEEKPSEHKNREGEHGDDWVKWVGGGLAVIGAVVGTVAFAKANEEKERRRRERSSGSVVEISSEIEDDGWVSVHSNSQS